MANKYSLTVNGQKHEIESDPDTPLLYILRNDLKLKGTKFGCGGGVCGACTVIMDGLAIFSCDTPIWSIDDKKIETIEGISQDGIHPLQELLIDEQAGQCGYCLSGIIMKVKAITDDDPTKSVDDIANELDRNLCRCGSQLRILNAVKKYLDGKSSR
ncbi:MAG: 2Fe-2S iron-sulfur cluster-binding protein [Pseudomonadota bacterium]|nr:(2Fe-2S)-binding protein [Rhodobiaceae bacterium]MEC7088017.1 2Fe-2S iron-sulfur cluster-binding protein [Pseudomonadota bacterium]MBS70532.1 (2Fe-2S)-binding protein [Rhodobiaceae bacterium]MEC7090368.1 2Fe-2S iron-sulfur cluster-binding protein [Pseudomonadota bacterium]MEC7269839.1 2Fe-2S iron-sulfur cluster-binding protein [Pseudomonadota bacterium]